MFFLYFIWFFFFIFVNYFFHFFENFFSLKNNPFLLKKRTFKYLSYFEKLILIFFYRDNTFDKITANLFVKGEIKNFRKNFYPMIESFHINYNRIKFECNSLSILSKQHNYYSKSFVFKLIFNQVLKNFFNCESIFLNFLTLQYLFINKYYNYNSSVFFYKNLNVNSVKLNRIFSLFLLNAKNKLIVFNLDIWNDWYNYNFDKNIFFRENLIFSLSIYNKIKNEKFKRAKIKKWIIIVNKYKVKIFNFSAFTKKYIPSIIYFNFNYISIFKINVNKKFKNLLKYYLIKFSESSVAKYININFLKNYNIQYLRKNRIFNKGRYSRNRQLYRTGVYWCLWLNIIMVYGLYFIFYRFSFNFGYFWWGVLFLAYSTIFSRVLKYNFYNLFFLFKEFNNLLKWSGFLIFNFFSFLNITLNKIIKINYNFIFLNYFKKSYFNFLLLKFNKFFKDKFSTNNIMLPYIWKGMKEEDKSFFRYKTIFHWFRETIKVLIL